MSSATAPRAEYPASIPEIETIVALVDFSDVTDKIIQQTRTMANALKAKVVLLHEVADATPVVSEWGAVPIGAIESESETKKQADYARLLALRHSLASDGVDVSVDQFEDYRRESIFEGCERLHADLIILGTHHHGAFYNMLIGTCTADVIKRAHCPVLVVPADRA